MTDAPLQIFVDFNRPTADRDTFATWASQLPLPVVLGTPVVMTDLEELRFDGFVTGLSADGRQVYVKVGRAPGTEPSRQLELLDVPDLPPTPVRSLSAVSIA